MYPVSHAPTSYSRGGQYNNNIYSNQQQRYPHHLHNRDPYRDEFEYDDDAGAAQAYYGGMPMSSPVHAQMPAYAPQYQYQQPQMLYQQPAYTYYTQPQTMGMQYIPTAAMTMPMGYNAYNVPRVVYYTVPHRKHHHHRHGKHRHHHRS
jgi:hypothetical protein